MTARPRLAPLGSAAFLFFLAACGAPDGARLEVDVRNVPNGTTDIRVNVTSDAGAAVLREVSFEGRDAFSFQVLLPFEGPADVVVRAVGYQSPAHPTDLATRDFAGVPLSDDELALVTADFSEDGE